MFIWTQFIDKLPVGLLAQLVERCTSIAEVMGSWQDSFACGRAFQNGDHELWKHFLTEESLAPYVAVLEHCSFDVLLKSCSSGRDTV